MQARWLFSLLALSSCTAPKQMYPGEPRARDQVALVAVKDYSGGGPLVDFVGSLLWHGFTRELELDALGIVRVDGTDARVASVEVLPGKRTFEVIGGRLEINHGIWENKKYVHGARFDVDLEAGKTYRFRAVPSKHAWPWAYEFVNRSTGEVLDTSEPEFEELSVPMPDLVARADWALTRWRTFYDGEELQFFPTGESWDQWGERVRVLKRPLSDPGVTLKDLAAEGGAAVPGELRHEGDLLIEDGCWVKRWNYDWKWFDFGRGDRWGLSLGTVVDGAEIQWHYVAKGSFDPSSQREWEVYFRELAQAAAGMSSAPAAVTPTDPWDYQPGSSARFQEWPAKSTESED